MQNVCPICGNDIDVTGRVRQFKCPYCKQDIVVIREKRKGKNIVILEEKQQ